MEKPQPPFLIFLHIQKTGGITLQRILRRKLGKSLPQRAVQLLKQTPQPTNLEAALKSTQVSDRYFAGHMCFGVHRFLPQPFTYVTWLREPVSRILSLYIYSKENSTAYYHQLAVNKTLEEFVLDTPLMELDNGQVRFLAGDAQDLFINRTPVGECTSELLELAKHNIDQHFLLIGLTEQFDQSLLLLQQKLGWNSCLYLRRNDSKKGSKPVISPELYDEICSRNWLDVQIYDYAKKRLKEELEINGLDRETITNFQRKNQKFNAYFNPLYTVYDQTKAILKGDVGRPS